MIFNFDSARSRMCPSLSLFIYCFFTYSGRIIRRFFPLGKILRPVLLECVTPITCYWSLSLVVRDEGELTLVFKVNSPVFQNKLLLDRMAMKMHVD